MTQGMEHDERPMPPSKDEHSRESAAAQERGATPATAADSGKLAGQAVLITLGLYLGYGIAERLSPWSVGFLLVIAFYVLPGFALRHQPQVAARWGIEIDAVLPRWSASAAGMAGIAMLVVFPPFLLLTWWFFADTCSPEPFALRLLSRAESLTPFAGTLEHFFARLCTRHSGAFFPTTIRVPASWLEYGGLAALYWIAIEVFIVALPEEVFHRSYLMSALEERWPPTTNVFGVPFGWAAIASSAIFAAGHLVSDARTDRLATFFPALLFAWLWKRSGSVWAPALVHAGANLLMQVVLASTFAP